MAASDQAPEIEVSIRRFLGVNTQLDTVFLGGQFLRSSQNLFPNITYRLSKRWGSLLYKSIGNGCINVTDILYLSSLGARYLYAYCQSDTNDFLAVILNDGPVTLVPGGTFTSHHRVGRLIRYAGFVYAGNGLDPLKQVTIGGAAIDLSPIGVTVTTGSLPPVSGGTPVASSPGLVTGTYAFAWAVFDTTTKLYVSRGPASSIDIVAANQGISFTAPSTALPANQVYKLFVSDGINPIDFATQQFDTFAPSAVKILGTVLVSANFIPLLFNVARTGNFFTLFLNRLVWGGDQNDPLAADATGVILPGYESTTFNTGAFFPAFARLPMPEEVTAVATAGVTSGFDPQSPLCIHTATRTTLYTGGDPYDPNGTAARVELSARIGNPSPATCVITPFGYFFLAMDSVYMLPPGGGFPQDVGYAIGDQIRTIPSARRPFAQAVFHKGFLKLAFSRPGEGQNLTQFWLDLRQGLTSPPSWWGPMTGMAISAFTTALDDPTEYDRGWAAVEGTDQIALIHQENVFTDLATPIIATLHTGTFDDGKPFLNKIFTRFRCIAHGQDMTTISLQIITDTGRPWNVAPMTVFGTGDAVWNHLVGQGKAQWNTAQWVSFMLHEVQSISPVQRPRGLSCEIVATHSAGSDIEFRDFELLYIPVHRKVRQVGEATS